MNIFTAGMPELCEELKNSLSSDIATYEHNFEQIIGFAKTGKLKKLCIYMDVWNVSGRAFNGMRGQGAAEKIHEIDPDISVLIWDGREYDSKDPDVIMPPAFQVTGTIHPIKNKNELYLDFDHYKEEDIDRITEQFFTGELTLSDIPQRECIEIML
ncbi:MAG: hypothetical protein PHF86_05290 [Candidatus Nanoarchaeia archaeon]|jgi:hypothetical protein|nr:hypothetical protein [Candidatus Nanoarchaeia archaeon]